MTKAQRATKVQEEGLDVPDVAPVESSQVVPVGPMDVDPRTGAQLRVGVADVDDEETVAEFILWLQQMAEEATGDSMSRLAEMLRRTQTTESVAEALREKTTVNGKDFVGVPFMATGVTVHEGRYEEEEIPYFVSIDAVNPTYPDGFVVNCGGEKILVHVRNLLRLNAFPIPLCITGKPTRKGRTILSFEVLEQTRE